MTRQWDTQAGREAIEKLRRNDKIARAALNKIRCCHPYASRTCNEAIDAMNRPLADADAVLGGEPRVDADSVPTPWPERTPFMIGVEALDAIKAGVEPETSGRTESPTPIELAELEGD